MTPAHVVQFHPSIDAVLDDGPAASPPPPTALPDSITAQLRAFRQRQAEYFAAVAELNSARESGDGLRIIAADDRWRIACVRSDTEAIWLGWVVAQWLPKEEGR